MKRWRRLNASSITAPIIQRGNLMKARRLIPVRSIPIVALASNWQAGSTSTA
jgi:hypothetical protein